MFKVLFLAGPTAVGKTEYAVKLACDLNGEIVSADSMQIYKYMDIGSAKPTAEERSLAKHYLIDEIDPRSGFNVNDYKVLAEKYLDDIHSQGKLPIVCGGTGLYFNSLIYDMDFSAPAGDENYRNEILKRFDGDADRLYAHLLSLDPNAAAPDVKNNVKRIVRYIERLEKGEQKLAQFSDMIKPSAKYSPVFIAITMDRELLYERINKRVDKLIDMGLEKEIEYLQSLGFTADDVAMKGIGYKELMAGLNRSEAIELIKSNTRHYAKRQLIWFRRYKDAVKWFDVNEDGYDAVLSYVKKELEQ